MSKLEKWVQKRGGPMKVAALLGVTPRVVYQWVRDGRTPKVLTMLKIEKLSKGGVTVKDMLRERR